MFLFLKMDRSQQGNTDLTCKKPLRFFCTRGGSAANCPNHVDFVAELMHFLLLRIWAQIMLILKEQKLSIFKIRSCRFCCRSAEKSTTINFHCGFVVDSATNLKYIHIRNWHAADLGSASKVNFRTDSMQIFSAECRWDFLKFHLLCCYCNMPQQIRLMCIYSNRYDNSSELHMSTVNIYCRLL